ncbi:aminotriazole resistance [Fusarium globosum]|uniref:Aminotriazole resistance n=1 Tax=Fusarium globosum TaxID=78864 RepID=A0A8H5YSZ5_9HYPO|nr:aminotriazole resistance [Fusarium globosum]
MEPLRNVSRQDSEKSEARREINRSNSAVQHATDTMIAVTESFRHHYQQQYGGYSPAAPAPTYTHFNSHSQPGGYSHSRSNSQLYSHSHARSPSSVSEISQNVNLLDMDVVSQLSVSEMTVSPVSPHRGNYIHTSIMPGRHPNVETDSLLDREMESEMAETPAQVPEDMIRLATPNLPPRLDTPHTPPPRFSVPVNLAEPRPNENPVVPTRPTPSDFSVNHGGLVQAARRFEAFRGTTQHHQYIALRPDMGTRSLPLGTVTHIRAGSDTDRSSPANQGLRRKPLNEGARMIEFNHATNESLFVAVICMAQVLTYASLAQTLTSARRIGESFFEPERTTHLAWFTSAFALSYGATTLFGNRIGNVCGQRYTFIAGYIWFALWSLLAGLSVYVQTSDNGGAIFFCFCRAMQGIGPAFVIPNGHGMLVRAYPPGPRKMLVMGFFDASVPFGFVIGSVMTGLFANYASWPWAFYSMAAVCTALGISSVLVIPAKRILVYNFEGNLWKRLDILGFAFGIAALIFFSVGWNQAPIVGWDTPQAYILIIAGIILIPLFTFFESQASHPLVPFKQIHLAAGITLGFVTAASAAFGVWAWYFVQFIEVIRGWGPLLTSVALMPVLVVGVIIAFGCWPFANRDFTAQLSMVVSSIASLISSALLASAPAQQAYWANSFVSAIFMGVGMVLIVPASSTVLGRDVPEGQLGLANSITNAAAAFAFSVGLGMAGAVEMGKSGDKDPFGGYRDAHYFGLGLGGLAFILALGLLCAALLRRRGE